MKEQRRCPGCGAVLGDRVKYCGECGRQMETPKGRGWLIALLAVIGIGVVAVFADLMYMVFSAEKTAEDGRGRRGESSAVREREEESEEPERAALAGTALETENGTYYFMEDGESYYFISEQTENFIKGRITLREAEEAELLTSEAAGLAGLVPGADYYRVDAVVSQELYFGSVRSGNTYTMYVATDGSDAAIYDSGWGDHYSAQVGELPEESLLARYFPAEETETVTVVATEAPVTTEEDFTVPGVNFGLPEGIDDSWYIVDAGAYYVFKNGVYMSNTLYRLEKDASGTEEAQALISVGEDEIIATMASDGTYLYYTVGSREENSYTVKSLERYELATGEQLRIAADEVDDFCVTADAIYYTDYARLVRVDQESLAAEEIWSYGVYCYEPVEDMLIVYDGEAWEMIDATDGEEYGYVVDGINYAYECDVAHYAKDVIFHVAFDYATAELSVRAVDVGTGYEYRIGESFLGTKSDTYTVAYSGKYVFFTANEWETLVRVDVTNGETRSIRLADSGYYYANEIDRLGEDIVLHAYDRQHNEYFLRMDPGMRLTPLW